jgi:murein DD-endopeptidase MepM/ murein hydrolase activator NlpD
MFSNISINRSGRIAKLFGLLMVAALLAASMPQMAYAQTCTRYHTVVSGDTLSGISVTYNISTAELAAANNLKEPYTLIIGQSLCIPGSTTTSSGSTSTSSSSNAPVVVVERDGKFLVIGVGNFPKKGNYYVKIKKGHWGTDTPWYKIGIFRTKKNTDVTRSFRLPSNFFDPSLITVCLKNAKTDGITCVPHWE